MEGWTYQPLVGRLCLPPRYRTTGRLRGGGISPRGVQLSSTAAGVRIWV